MKVKKKPKYKNDYVCLGSLTECPCVKDCKHGKEHTRNEDCEISTFVGSASDTCDCFRKATAAKIVIMARMGLYKNLTWGNLV